ncbi:phosphotransferase, partial [Cardiobacterium hominis]
MQTPTENRESARRAFAVSALGAGITLTALGGDASFRRYFRVQDGDRSFILMDAPPEHGGVALFQTRSDQFRTCGLPVPEIYAADTAQGLLLLQDYGDRWLYHDLAAAPEAAMTQALALLGDWQQATANLRDTIPPY